MAWVDNIKTWTGLSVEESVRMTEGREKMEKVRPWCGQQSDGGWLKKKNRTRVNRHQKGKTDMDFLTEARNGEWHQLSHTIQTDNHTNTQTLSFFTGQIFFLLPNQQRQSTEDTEGLYDMMQVRLINIVISW